MRKVRPQRGRWQVRRMTVDHMTMVYSIALNAIVAKKDWKL